MRGSSGKSRKKLLPFLPVFDKTGKATQILAERSGYVGTPSGLAQLLKSMEADGEIVRDVRGKRTYSIQIPGTRAMESTPASSEPVETPAPASPAPAFDYDALAGSLLERVIAAAMAPEKLQADFKSMSARLSAVLEDNDRLRSKLSIAVDEVNALKLVNDGLRQRMLAMQSNLDAMLKAPHVSIGREAEDYLRELARLMRQPPNHHRA